MDAKEMRKAELVSEWVSARSVVYWWRSERGRHSLTYSESRSSDLNSVLAENRVEQLKKGLLLWNKGTKRDESVKEKRVKNKQKWSERERVVECGGVGGAMERVTLKKISDEITEQEW